MNTSSTNHEHSEWDAGFLRLADEYKKGFYDSDTEVFLKQLANANIILGCWLVIYGILVKRKRIEPIENIPENEKKELWGEARRLSKDKSKERLIKVSKAVHCLGQYIQM